MTAHDRTRLIGRPGVPFASGYCPNICAPAYRDPGECPYTTAPGNFYRVGETLRIADQTVTIEATRRGENPKQGSFAILTLRFPNGTQRSMAAEIPGAPAAEGRLLEAEPTRPETSAAPVQEKEEPLPLPAVGTVPPRPETAVPLAGKPARRHRIRRVYTTFWSIIRKLVHGLLRRKARVPGLPKENPEPLEKP